MKLPFRLTGEFVEYRGNEKSLQNYVDLEQLFTTNLPGTDVFGGISGEVRGTRRPRSAADRRHAADVASTAAKGIDTNVGHLGQRHQRPATTRRASST